MRRSRSRPNQPPAPRGSAGAQSGRAIEGSGQECALPPAVHRAGLPQGSAGGRAPETGDDDEYRRTALGRAGTMEPGSGWRRVERLVELGGFITLSAAATIAAGWAAIRYLIDAH